MRRRDLLAAAAAAVAAACTPSAAAPASPVPGVAGRPDHPNAGKPAAGIWPTFMVAMNAQVKDAYLYAATHPMELSYIPCYCGCGAASHDAHQDNARCFVAERLSDGWMILEPHGSQCGTCVGIALDTKAMLGRGATLKEARAQIDQKWAAAGPGTPTRLPN